MRHWHLPWALIFCRRWYRKCRDCLVSIEIFMYLLLWIRITFCGMVGVHIVLAHWVWFSRFNLIMLNIRASFVGGHAVLGATVRWLGAVLCVYIWDAPRLSWRAGCFTLHSALAKFRFCGTVVSNLNWGSHSAVHFACVVAWWEKLGFGYLLDTQLIRRRFHVRWLEEFIWTLLATAQRRKWLAVRL